jgi:hypothetical protein
MWTYAATLPYSFMAWYLVKHRGNFTFTLGIPTDLTGNGSLFRKLM